MFINNRMWSLNSYKINNLSLFKCQNRRNFSLGFKSRFVVDNSFENSNFKYSGSNSLISESTPSSLNFCYNFSKSFNRSFQTTVQSPYRSKEKVSFSSLKKHLKPDGLTGSERRRKLVKDEKKSRFSAKPVGKNTRGFIPSRFKLTSVPSDAKLDSPADNKSYERLSAVLKYKERLKRRKDRNLVKEVGSTDGVKAVTKFDMADLDIIESLSENITEATFDNLGLRPEVIAAVKQLFPSIDSSGLRPTEIQALAIPEILRKKHSHVLCAAETGSGKTLAYLLSIINRLKEQEASHPNKLSKIEVSKPKRNVGFGDDASDPFLNGTVPSLETSSTNSPSVLDAPGLRLLTTSSIRKLNRPRAVVLVPSCPLANQVYAVAKRLSHFAKFRTILLNRETVRKDLLRRLQSPVDLLVTTPASLINFIDNGLLSLSEVNQLTIDEADTLFEKGFGLDVKKIIKSLQITNCNQKRSYQLTVVSATLPKLVLQMLDKEFPDIVRITTPSLHKSLPRCNQHFVDLKDYKGNRTLGLLDVLRQFEQRSGVSSKQKEKDRTLIFCNTRKAVTIVQTFLNERSITSLSLYGGDPYKNHPPASPQQIHNFLYPSSCSSSVYDFAIPERNTSEENLEKRSSKKQLEEESSENISEQAAAAETKLSPKTNLNLSGAKILVCTDLASRGLDTTCVNHVIMFDFPTSVIDYLHRCGRTARAGQPGVVTSLIGKKDRALSERIRRSVRSKTVLA